MQRWKEQQLWEKRAQQFTARPYWVHKQTGEISWTLPDVFLEDVEDKSNEELDEKGSTTGIRGAHAFALRAQLQLNITKQETFDALQERSLRTPNQQGIKSLYEKPFGRPKSRPKSRPESRVSFADSFGPALRDEDSDIPITLTAITPFEGFKSNSASPVNSSKSARAVVSRPVFTPQNRSRSRSEVGHSSWFHAEDSHSGQRTMSETEHIRPFTADDLLHPRNIAIGVQGFPLNQSLSNRSLNFDQNLRIPKLSLDRLHEKKKSNVKSMETGAVERSG